MPGDIVAVRSQTRFGKLIRAALGSYTNHNGMIVRGADKNFWIGEAVQPFSKLTSLAEYERAMANGLVVRIWRVPHATDIEREDVAKYFTDFLIGLKYPVTVASLCIYRIVNHLPFTIHGDWCTKLDFKAWGHVDSNIFNRPDGKKKKNPTPRTLENRLVAGVINDVTNECVGI